MTICSTIMIQRNSVALPDGSCTLPQNKMDIHIIPDIHTMNIAGQVGTLQRGTTSGWIRVTYKGADATAVLFEHHYARLASWVDAKNCIVILAPTYDLAAPFESPWSNL